jgi:hypothetical protein
MPNTFTLIASSTVGSGGAANIEFTSIPGTYTDLKIVASIRLNTAGVQPDGFGFRFNSDSGANYSQRQLFGDGSSAGSSQNTGLTFGYGGPLTGTGATASTFGSLELYIPNYTASVNKSVSVDRVTENNGTAADAGFNANLWSNTAAITSIRLFDFNGNNFLQYSTAYLYGIKNS